MLHALAFAAATTVEPIVSAAWLQAHLADPQVRVIYVGDHRDYDREHIPGARILDHMDTVRMDATGHRLAANDVLVRSLTKAGVADDAHVVLYGDSPLATGWVYTAIAAIGHGETCRGSMAAWRSGTQSAAPSKQRCRQRAADR